MKTRAILACVVVCCTVLGPSFAQTVLIDGQPAKAGAVVTNGKVMVDAAALLKALGLSYTWDANTKTLRISSTKQTTTGAGGTNELAGGDGVLGKVYTLGKTNPVFFSLQSLEYVKSRITVSDSYLCPDGDEKLLVLHYTIQNPAKTDMQVDYRQLKFTAVDSGDENLVITGKIGIEDTKQELDLKIKPAQKVKAYAVIKVLAKRMVPKLIVQAADGPVLRFDLHTGVKPLPAALVDPDDPTGTSLNPKPIVKMGEFYPLSWYDLRLDKVAYTTDVLPKEPLPDGKRFMVATFTIKNQCPESGPLDYRMFKGEVRTANGLVVPWDSKLWAGTAGSEEADMQLRPGDDMQVRAYFTIGANDNVTKISIFQSEKFVYSFDVSDAK